MHDHVVLNFCLIVIKISVSLEFFRHDLSSVTSVSFSVMSLHILHTHTLATNKTDALSWKHLAVSEKSKDSCKQLYVLQHFVFARASINF